MCRAQVAVEAARAAGEVIQQAFNKPKAVEHKGSVDLVTETDKASEHLVYTRIKEAYPNHKCGGSSSSSSEGLHGALQITPGASDVSTELRWGWVLKTAPCAACFLGQAFVGRLFLLSAPGSLEPACSVLSAAGGPHVPVRPSDALQRFQHLMEYACVRPACHLRKGSSARRAALRRASPVS